MYKLVGLIFSIAELILLVRIFVSWLPVNRDNKLVDLLYKITEPVLSPIRSGLNRLFNGNMFDFSGIIALLILAILRYIVLGIIT